MFDLIKLAIAQGVDTDFGRSNNVAEYVNNILRWLVPSIVGIAVLMMIYAGYLYMTSQGNPDNINQAKEIIIGVVIGIMLLFAIRLILTEIGI